VNRVVQVQLLLPGPNSDERVARLAAERLDADTDGDLRRSEQLSSDALSGGAATVRTPLRRLTGLVHRWT
jgi:hypothetical protein